MKKVLKDSVHLALAFGLVAAVLAVTTQARQGSDLRVISAKAGGVNLVSGGAEFRRAGEKVWMSLSVRDDLSKGDMVRTASGGRIELLLNPGSYWRASGSTEFELTNMAQDDLTLRLAEGSAVIEATGFGNYELNLTIVTPQTRVRVARAGIYRLNVLPTGETVLVVEKGRAYVGEGEGLRVRDGKVVRVGAGSAAPEVTKFDKKARDEFDLWSRERGRELARANENLSRKQTNSLLADVNFERYFSVGRPGHGFWLWNGAANSYTFLSFYPEWRSPYGFGYRNWFISSYNFGCYSCPTGGDNRGLQAHPGSSNINNSGAINNSSQPVTPGVAQPGGPAPTAQPAAPVPVNNPGLDRPFSGPRDRIMDQPQR
jgi:hypothetical protein